MIKASDKNKESAILRKRAELKLTEKKDERIISGDKPDEMKLIHELEVHQIELEMQYEELLVAEAKAESAVKKLTSLYDFAPVGYLTLDAHSNICDLNFLGASLLGKERSRLLNTDFREYVTADVLPIFNQFTEKIYETRSKQSCEITLNLGKDYPAFVQLDGIIAEDDLKCLITMLDISERKIALERLRSSESRYRRLFESAKDGILILDAYSGKIVDVNPFLMEMLGYKYEEFLGKELWELGIFKNIEESKAAFTDLQKNGYVRFEDLPLETKNGKPINVEYVSNVYFVENAKVIQCNIRDITARRKAEEALLKSESLLRELNATKDKFFSIISHDLKSPFNSIIGLSDLLSEKARTGDFNGVEEYANIINKSSWRAMDLLSNLIEWSRLQTGRMEFKLESTDIVSLINEVTELSGDAALQKCITITKELPSYFNVLADKQMISTVLRNIISNAIKFTRPGGKISITGVHDKKEFKVSVIDNGVGIKKEALDKLFLIESSSSTKGTKDEEGTGLGLILCKDFLSKHNGRIWAESEYEKGSIFMFTLPA